MKYLASFRTTLKASRYMFRALALVLWLLIAFSSVFYIVNALHQRESEIRQEFNLSSDQAQRFIQRTSDVMKELKYIAENRLSAENGVLSPRGRETQTDVPASWTDVLPEFGGDTYGSDNFMQQRGNGFATYRNTDFFGLVDGLNFAVQYQGKNGSVDGEGMTNNGRGALRQNGDGVGGSITYDYEGFGIGAAVSSSKRTDAQNGTYVVDNVTHNYIGTGDRAETYTGGLKYDANNIYLAAQYTQTYNATRVGSLGWANKAQNFEAVAQYQFDFGLRPSLAYLQSKGKNLGVINGRNYDDEDILKYVDVGATYYFNKNMSTYVDYKINLLDDNQFTRDAGINTDNIVALGLVYQF